MIPEYQFIASHLSIDEYQQLIYSSKNISFRLKPLLTWQAYEESIRIIKVPDPSLFIRLDLEFFNETIFERLVFSNLFAEVQRTITKDCLSTTFKQELFADYVRSSSYSGFGFNPQLTLYFYDHLESIDGLQLDDSEISLLIKQVINSNDLPYIQMLFRKSIDFTLADNFAIKWSSEIGHLDLVKILLQSGVDPSIDDNYPIRFASRNGNLEIVQLLLNHELVNPAANNNSPLTLAARNGHENIVALLLKHPDVDPSAFENYAVRYASENGHLAVVQMLLKDERVNPSGYDNYAIRNASRNGHLQIVQLLLVDKRVDPTTRFNYALRMACEQGYTEIVECLLEDERVASNAGNKGNYCLLGACKKNFVDIVELLLAKGTVDPTIPDNAGLRIAKSNGYSEIVEILVRYTKTRETGQPEL
ncbi:hypothetical protein HDV01_006431 [Terramyces sp. JEL0728]|nr:hypothetical protein HDV01_006431 [Terramyces sp. JEL0728]